MCIKPQPIAINARKCSLVVGRVRTGASRHTAPWQKVVNGIAIRNSHMAITNIHVSHRRSQMRRTRLERPCAKQVVSTPHVHHRLSAVMFSRAMYRFRPCPPLCAASRRMGVSEGHCALAIASCLAGCPEGGRRIRQRVAAQTAILRVEVARDS